VVMAIEQHVDWVADCLTYLDHHGLSRIEASEAGQNEWVEHANRLADSTLLDHADSWYLGANIPGKPRVVLPYMGGLARYGKKIAAAAADGYRGFELSAE
ncbi:MAG TPA: steroid monooxygenase, partial [Ilumatobacteraceae bacterium]|nr:steroid monooxygenase [Ilumatobacteraceae bacterium]